MGLNEIRDTLVNLAPDMRPVQVETLASYMYEYADGHSDKAYRRARQYVSTVKAYGQATYDELVRIVALLDSM